MGGVPCCLSGPTGSATAVSMQSLKSGLEHDRRNTKARPEVWVTINKVILGNEEHRTINPGSFSLRCLHTHVTVEIMGSNEQVVREIGSEAALRLMERVSVQLGGGRLGLDESTLGKKPQERAQDAVSKPRPQDKPDRVGAGAGTWDKGTETKSFDLHVTVKISKEVGDDEITVEVLELRNDDGTEDNSTPKSTAKTSRKELRSEGLTRHIRLAMAERTTEVLAALVSRSQ